MSISGNNTVSQSTANQRVFGIASKDAKAAPIPSASTLAAASGDSVGITVAGGVALLEYGDTVTAGQRLKADSVGRGVPMATSGSQQNVGAYALEGGASGELHMVQVYIEALDGSAS